MQSRAARVEETRIRILEASYQLFLEQPYDEVSLERMAFYAATEVMLWKLLRRDFGLSRKETEAVLLALVSGLVKQRQKKEKEEG